MVYDLLRLPGWDGHAMLVTRVPVSCLHRRVISISPFRPLLLFSSSGIDICTFSILTLLFRVSEKVATPTSVVLMAINTLVGFMYRQLAMGGVEREAIRFFTVCVPVVVIGDMLDGT